MNASKRALLFFGGNHAFLYGVFLIDTHLHDLDEDMMIP